MGKIMVGFQVAMTKIAKYANRLPDKSPAEPEGHLLDIGHS